MKSKIIPFGRYKGQPVESLAQDKQYLDWLLSQSWFFENHKDLHTVIINNFQEPSETPEHNSLQGMFLDEAFRLSFLKVALQKYIPLIRGDLTYVHDRRGRDLTTIYSAKPLPDLEISVQRFDFEKKGIDVTIDCLFNCLATYYDGEDGLRTRLPKTFRAFRSIGVEIKPSVGDDYPAVLRSMQSIGVGVLFVEGYHGKGVNKSQFESIFNNQRIAVVFKNEIS